MRNKMFLGIGIVIFFTLCWWVLNYMENYEEVFYAVIDNSKVVEVSKTDRMKYEYTLSCYNKEGNKKEIKFKTSRILKEDAYISLLVRATGVNKWEEVRLEEIPSKAQAKLG